VGDSLEQPGLEDLLELDALRELVAGLERCHFEELVSRLVGLKVERVLDAVNPEDAVYK
jgi:hypothetical protein